MYRILFITAIEQKAKEAIEGQRRIDFLFFVIPYNFHWMYVGMKMYILFRINIEMWNNFVDEPFIYIDVKLHKILELLIIYILIAILWNVFNKIFIGIK